MPVFFCGITIKAHQRNKTLGKSANDGEPHRQSEPCGTYYRLRSSANRNPYKKLLLMRSRINAKVIDGRPVFAGPRNFFVFVNPDEEFKLLRKEFVVIVQIISEQRERFDERSP